MQDARSPHEVLIQGSKPILGQGRKAGRKAYIPFDRSLFYQQMVQIEAAWRRDTGQTAKITETMAQIISQPAQQYP
jgi:hypothetical protein